MPSRPVWGYQLSQGLHVASGIALVPLVLAKLWVVYPRLFTWPPVRSVGHGLERLLIAPLVAGTLFQLVTGLANIVQWYPWGFFFPATHWAMAWVVVGALLVHVAVKLPVRPAAGATPDGDPTAGDARGQVGAGRETAGDPLDRTNPESSGPESSGLESPRPVDQDPVSRDRRGLLLAVAAAAGVVTLATVGQTVTPLSAVSLLASRRSGSGPQGVPVNRTARSAGVIGSARDPGWRLQVRPAPGAAAAGHALTRTDLLALPQHTVRLPIACVEGWSTSADWSGVRLRDVLDLAGIDAGAHLRAVSLQTGGLYGTSPLGPSAARDPLTLLALRLNGQELSLDHGYPVRLIAPDRPGVQQTKWLAAIEVVAG